LAAKHLFVFSVRSINYSRKSIKTENNLLQNSAIISVEWLSCFMPPSKRNAFLINLKCESNIILYSCAWKLKWDGQEMLCCSSYLVM